MASRPTTVLVVDDEPEIVNLLTQFLEKDGYEVVGATDPEQALTVIQSTPSLKLIVSDLMMPKMDGAELIRRACRSRPELRILFITGGFHGVTFRKTDRMLHKPIDINAFSDAVRRSLTEPEAPTAGSNWPGPERRRRWPFAATASVAG